MENKVVIFIYEYHHALACLLMQGTHQVDHADVSVFYLGRNAVLPLIALQRLVNQRVKLLNGDNVTRTEVKPYHGVLLPFPIGCGDKQLRLFDALLSGERLEQVAATFEDSGQRRDEQRLAETARTT